MKRKGNNRGAMEMSFGMIFSIILIIFFLSFAFFGIRAFLKVQDTAKTTKFINDFKADVERVWKSSETSTPPKEYYLPSGKEKVCFVDFSASGSGINDDIYNDLERAYSGSENMVFYPVNFEDVESVKVNYINIEEMTNDENPFCINVVNGKVKLRLTKDISDASVTVERAD